MNRWIFCAVLLGCCAGFGCSGNVERPVSKNGGATTTPEAVSATTPEANPWKAVVCSSRAKTLTLSAGVNETDGEVFAAISENSTQRIYELPPRLRSFSKIYFKGSSSDKSQVELCILYNGKPAKRVEFDDDEDVMVAASDTDELNKCRCIE